jgi:hypothetical protein
MKRIVLALLLVLACSVSIGFAAPLNNLAQSQTAIGVGTDVFYLEHKLADNFTLGFQNVDLDGSNVNDLYGQFHLSNNLRAIIGSRDFDSGSKMYLGLGVSGPMAPEWEGYASLVAGSEFKELQVGANFALSHNFDLNLNYRSFMPDVGRDRNQAGMGVSYKF